MAKTLFDKIWDAHEVQRGLIYIDLHLVHEVTSPQAFDGLRLAGRKVRRPDRTLATADHNVPTTDGPITDPLARAQLEALQRNCDEFGIRLFATGSGHEGIVHVIGPELGLTQPGMTIVCGDSHTSTHGAFGALAFGVGTSEVEHVLATQTLPQAKPKTMKVQFDGSLPFALTAKDLVLGAIGQIGVAGGVGHVVEYAGEAIEALSMEGRMTVCNMSIEAGARAGLSRWVRPPAPCRPSKFRFDVEAQRSPGERMSGFMPRHIEHPALRHSNPASRNTRSSSISCMGVPGSRAM